MAKTENEHQQSTPKKTEAPVPDGASDAMKDKTIRILEAMNKKLRARLKQVELKQVELKQGGVTEEAQGEATKQADAEEDKRFSTMIKGLRGDIDAAYVLKKALETDLQTTRARLSEEEAARQRFEARADILEAKAALADQLREDISFVEGEQNKTFRRLEEVSSELKQALEERDRLAEAKKTRDARIAQLLKQRFELEADIVELKERLEEMVSFFSEKSGAPSGAKQAGSQKKGSAK